MSLRTTTGQRTRSISHLLLSGYNPLSPPPNYSSSTGGSYRQSPSNPSLAPIPFSTWLASVGRERDTYDGPLSIPHHHSISSSIGHSLIRYRNYEGIDRVFSIGRNEAGQLGVGFASQEGTRGLVEGFEGEGIEGVDTASQASYLVVKQDQDETVIYSTGNLARGRLSQPSLFNGHDTKQSRHDEDEEPSTRTLPTMTKIECPEEMRKIVEVKTGFEHLLVLDEFGQIWATGCNTDGQLGLGSSSLTDIYQLTRVPLPESITSVEGGVSKIVAGGDTSGLITKSGKLFTWGNSEYSQACHGHKIDQISSPLLALAKEFGGEGEGKRVVDYQCGGSFGVVLDDRHRVWTAGYGAIGQGRPGDRSQPSTPNHQYLYNPIPTLLESLSSHHITRIRAAFGYAVAISDAGEGSRMFGWGLNNVFGRLGIGALPPVASASKGGFFDPTKPPRVEMHVYEPREIELPLRELGLERSSQLRRKVRTVGEPEEGEVEPEVEEEDVRPTWKLADVELGSEGMWVVVEEEAPVE